MRGERRGVFVFGRLVSSLSLSPAPNPISGHFLPIFTHLLRLHLLLQVNSVYVPKPHEPICLSGLIGTGLVAATFIAAGPDSTAMAAVDSLQLTEPANALSLPTWAVNVSSVVEWITVMALAERCTYGERILGSSSEYVQSNITRYFSDPQYYFQVNDQ
ncbi:hypothetical protein Bca4012_090929 [Brassica carinata]|uniref:Uncharacterized protein n=2 Tax=Brassica TaxID=3705 RepID=A0A8X7P506_BRACI|nr:hypothetical protein Bca52824_085737 [Brassica carinata]KAH0904778.1 hypothetical protein HID58_044281 [Brassica napus]CAF2079415.1 unnamed protein product [Brassica napus]